MKKPSALITGITGFAGSYLAEELLTHGYTVSGTVYNNEPTNNIKNIIKDLQLVALDILKPEKCRRVVNKIKPDYIFHLAAIASVSQSFKMERLTFNINFDGTLNMLEAARELPGLKKFIFIGSAECYGIFSPPEKTLTENQPFNPISPYGVSKAAAEQVTRYYARHHQLPVGIARPFNHSGPRQNEHFVIPAFARQVALIEVGRQGPVMKVGDLSPQRDLSDVRDIVCGYRLIGEKGRPGEVYHLSTGKAVSIKTVLDTLLKLAHKTIKVTTDKSRLRPNDIPVLRGNNKKAVQQLGFKIRYSLQDTLQDTLNYWRNQVQ
ncbi:MAG: GDP-mannose 4,6-dehydratase [candidate division Zixibacteria bacterium]|nr:GDP-mannose 4,6-dehydratase [candidate division Zixibacteria bacterium]